MLKNLLAIYAKLDDTLRQTRLTKFMEILGCEIKEDRPRLRSRIAQTLDVPDNVRLGPSLAVALPESVLNALRVFRSRF